MVVPGSLTAVVVAVVVTVLPEVVTIMGGVLVLEELVCVTEPETLSLFWNAV